MSLLSYLRPQSRPRLLYGCGTAALVVLVTLGIFASNGWFPRTDPLSGKRTGWFGSESSPPVLGGVDEFRGRGGASAPLPSPTATPQLSKEYIYAGSRLLAVEDANAHAAPPTDLAVWRPSNGTWYVLGGPGSTQTIQGWGQNGDIPVPGDYDGDGKTDFSVFRPGTPYATWYIIHSSTGAWAVFQYAVSSDLHAQADYDGDGKTDAAVYRPPSGSQTNGFWYIQGSTAGYYTQTWGEAGDLPAPADYDGDGKADLAIWRPSTQQFYSINSSNGNWHIVDMAQSGEPVSTDYDGDGKADFAIFTASTGTWKIRQSTTATFATTTGWGVTGDIPVPNDYDGDARSDITVWRPTSGTWYIIQSATATIRQQPWGEAGDVPVPAFYRR